MKRRTAFIVFLCLSLINGLIFINRNSFQYRPYSDRKELYTACDENCEARWKPFASSFPASEMAEAKSISDSMTTGAVGTEEKILRIGDGLYQRFYRRLYKPNTETAGASPLKQYQLLCSDSSRQLWCSNFAQMFAYFCWSQGIITRVIEIQRPGDHHVVNECYLPEKKSWIGVDLTSNILRLGTGTRPMTIAGFRDSLRGGKALVCTRSGETGPFATRLTGSEAFLDYYRGQYQLYYYHHVDYFATQTPAGKLRSYLLPVSWYDILDENGGTNLLFYVKLLCILLWIISGVVVLVNRKKKKYDRSKKHQEKFWRQNRN